MGAGLFPVQMGQTMRRQLLKHGVRVGSVSPGPVASALLKDWPEENLRKAKRNFSLNFGLVLEWIGESDLAGVNSSHVIAF